ncbi:hypothetical protein MSS2_01443 [Mycobacterium marinum]|uniref:hypothetical protein n=1 Tax=Mycobacterium marinum TaxID=1781 RepID=UPI000ED30A0B|nr:hypothetical protein [Mycobacterium marinum]RFZ57311.1 hypothetical protein MSS2_01443 [Mycobacterium marinum]RFZ65871.1 hypothetical protein DE4576_03205 [Mycobacterium marinum]
MTNAPVTNAPEAEVIYLQSHPMWLAARQRENQRLEEMRRHPAYLGRQRAAAMGVDVSSMGSAARAWPSADSPA